MRKGGGGVAGDRRKDAAVWFYTFAHGKPPAVLEPEEETVYRDEAIRPREAPPEEKLPSLLRAARSLENQGFGSWQNREVIFLKQAKLLANYEDDYAFSGSVQRYYPTYQSLTDRELRGYFSWRTALRRGEVRKAPPAFAFLYIYELLNGIGTDSPMEGYRKLTAFAADYGSLDETVLPYLRRWLFDYILYYDLPTELLPGTEQAVFDGHLMVLNDIGQFDTPRIMEAVKYFAPRWLGRSRFYAQHSGDMDAVIAGTLRGISAHYAVRCKKTMVEQYFGPRHTLQIRLFDTAVFLDKGPGRDRDVVVDPLCVYHCRHGLWTAEKYGTASRGNPKLEALVKTVDSVMRPLWGDSHPVKPELDTKWIRKLIEEQAHALLEEKQAAEKKKLHLDFGQLDKIRRDAAVTQDKLMVEEEMDPAPEEEAPVPEAEETEEDSILTRQELRFVRCLLSGQGLGWLREEGVLASVLADSINEKLYDTFQDTVLTMDDPPALVEDYVDELKEMVQP